MAETPITSAEATTRLATARATLASAEATLKGLLADKAEAQEWAHREALVTLRPLIMAAEDEIGIAQAAIPKAEAALAEALAREEQDRRWAAYNDAAAGLVAGEEARIVEYPSLAHRIREIIRMQAEADLAVERVNAALPNGATPLRSLKEQYAGWRGLPREDLESIIVERWVALRSGTILADAYQSQVADEGNGYGTFGIGLDQTRVTKRRFRHVKFLPPTSGHIYDGFANMLSLPGLPEEPAYYTPSYSDEPNDVLNHLRELEEREAAHRPPMRAPQYRYDPIEDAQSSAA